MFKISFIRLPLKYGFTFISLIGIAYYVKKNHSLNNYYELNRNVESINNLILVEIISTLLLMMSIGIPTIYFAQKPDHSNRIISTVCNNISDLIESRTSLDERNKLIELIELVKTYNNNLEQLNVVQKENSKMLKKILDNTNNSVKASDIIENMSEIAKDTNLTNHDMINIKRNIYQKFY